MIGVAVTVATVRRLHDWVQTSTDTSVKLVETANFQVVAGGMLYHGNVSVAIGRAPQE